MSLFSFLKGVLSEDGVTGSYSRVANLLAPIANPFALPSPNANGAIEWCRNCNGALDNAPQGSIADGSSGHGALIQYEATTLAYRVISGVSGVGNVYACGTTTSCAATVQTPVQRHRAAESAIDWGH